MMQILESSRLFHMTVYLEVSTNDITSIILQTNMYRDFSHCGFNWAIPFNMCTPPPPPTPIEGSGYPIGEEGSSY
jgi:hypothetical protein